MQDDYEILSIDSTASDELARKAYKRLSKKYYLEIIAGNNNFTEKMTKLNTAYQNIIALIYKREL